MQIVTSVVELREIVNRWRKDGERIAFVPTMGNLHAGHIKLVQSAKSSSDRSVVSIFVNPTQFGQGEDYATYPRTEQEDFLKLEATGSDLVFLPSVAEMYPDDALTVISVKGLSDLHCGEFRPGHFNGVATVVCKLLNLVQPDTAFFGQKDFQQLAIIRKMVQDLNIPVAIESVETMRESNGLAMSSRNGYLSSEELNIAPKLYRTLCDARHKILAKEKPYTAIENESVEILHTSGFQVDYFRICRSNDLLAANPSDNHLVVLAAAKLGRTRLIDNITVNLTTV
ncbi:MAG: pantoate--beta-alanine ligase [Methylococcaceae bacterium]|nr:pantoate--beta-alanine ligase [Methylococcaceae bacterium]